MLCRNQGVPYDTAEPQRWINYVFEDVARWEKEWLVAHLAGTLSLLLDDY
jgi:hypothetical protein